MGEANEGRRRSKAMENLSLQMEKFPRDLLQRFMSCSNNSNNNTHHREEEESEEIELNLGLSLGGRFGVDKNSNKLIRSSSVVGTMPFFREDITPPAPPYSATALMRTSSLPTETEEQWRKRKELQTLRRMEAKRRRSEKQRNSKTERDWGGGETVGESPSPTPLGLPSWAANAKQVVLGDVLTKVKPSSQGSADSQGGGSSSGLSEMESKPFHGKFNLSILFKNSV